MKKKMISRSDFYYELTVDIVATCLFALLFIIILFLNNYTKFDFNSKYHSDIVNNEQQGKTENEMTQISTTTSSSS
jgi:hypothetical protein